MRFAFVMDPIERVDIDKDTTFALMLAAQARGHTLHVLHARDLAYGGAADGPIGRMAEVQVERRRGSHARVGTPAWRPLAEMDAVFMRSDPPFDIDYFMATHLLEQARGRTLVVNDPRGLREANEKLYALCFPDFVPPTVVSADPARLLAFMDEQGGECIVKPLDGCGGAGVFHLRRGDRNVNAILEMSTANGRRYLMAQRYVPEVREGDKRILLLDGEPLGAVLRIPREDETRGNIHVGGRVAKAALTERERAMCAAMRERLRADGLYFVGIDVIGGWLTEVNVTSPTGIQEIEGFDGVDLSSRVIAWVEERAPRARTAG